MSAIGDTGDPWVDPWDWTVDRVIQELCTANRSWVPPSASMRAPDPASLEKVLHEQEVIGSVLLVDVDDMVMRNDFGLKVLGRRAFIRSAIDQLRLKSPKYQAHRQTQLYENINGTDINRVISEYMQRSGSMVSLGHGLQLPSPADAGSPAFSNISVQPETQVPVDGAGLAEEAGTQDYATKRQKLDSAITVDGNDAPQFLDALEHHEPDISTELILQDAYKNQGAESISFAPQLAPQNTEKKRKRIAPTLITTEIDPNRNRDIPTAADDVFLDIPEAHEPGMQYIGNDGKKRMVPMLQQAYAETNDFTFQQKALGIASDLRRSTNRVTSLSRSYLGKKKMGVDEIFYSCTEVGQEIADVEEDPNFSGALSEVPSGKMLYVHRVMKTFLRTQSQTIIRNGKAFSAVTPYNRKLVPRFQKPSFTLYYSTPEGKIKAKREEIRAWPEIDPEAVLRPQLEGERTATFNPLGPEMLMGIGSYDQWDPSSLEKYKHIEGGDELLPLYGDSDSDNDYDEATWREIEEERGELERPLKPMKRHPLSKDEIDQAIDAGITELVSKWIEKGLPKQQRRAWRLWNKSRVSRNKKEQINIAQGRHDYILQRIGKMRKEIHLDVWSSQLQVQKQTRIMELDIFEREDLAFIIATLEQKSAPKKFSHVPSVSSKKSASTIASDEKNEEEDGELLESESEPDSSNDSMDEFVVPDEPVPFAEEDLQEMNLADTEDENEDEDTQMSDATDSREHTLARPPPPPPTPTIRKAHTKEPASQDFDDDSYLLLSPTDLEEDSAMVKGEELPLPQLPLATNTASEVIDLTLISSDEITSDSSDVIDLVTPVKEKSTRSVFTIINRSSPVNDRKVEVLPDDIDMLFDPKNLPDHSDPVGIGRLSYGSLIGDQRRLLIKVLYAMGLKNQSLMFNLLSSLTEDELWKNMINVMGGNIKGLDEQTIGILSQLIRLFETFIEARYCPWNESTTKEQMKKLSEERAEFSPFYAFCSSAERYFPKLKAVQSTDNDDEDPLPANRRRSQASTSSEENIVEGSASQKKRKRKIFEDSHARKLRDADKKRLDEQEERRKKLHANLAKAGRADDEDQGKIIINDAATEGQKFIYVNRENGHRIKKHQIDGLRFMWNQVVTITDDTPTQGCLLAHTMGLGKTMQAITLLVAISEAASSEDPAVFSQIPEHLRSSRTLILCPPSLIDNWLDEFLLWAPRGLLGDFRKIDSCSKMPDRLLSISNWYDKGGVLIIGYEMFRTIITNKKPKNKDAPLIKESDHNNVLKQLLEGPNIIIADEAHKMKNADSGIAIATKQFASKSRIALTGSPLANNVTEYHTMIEWVAPGYLGDGVEFRAKYVEPIQAGSYHDSTPYERRKMLKMLGVLQVDLAPKVHRADMSVLRNDLPPKKEFVITVPLTDIQRKAYVLYVRSMTEGRDYSTTKAGEVTQTTVWHWLAILSLLCNHPRCFEMKLLEREQEASQEVAEAGRHSAASKNPTDLDDAVNIDLNTPVWKAGVSSRLIDAEADLFSQEAPDMTSVELSYKVKILCEILDASKVAGDKTLVFSQSIPTINFLEGLCLRQRRKYARLDGNTKMKLRQKLTKEFNTGDTDILLISTTAGGLGLNLYGANRVIIFDFKFNPIMEEQAVGRAYRIGQKKPTYVYRFVAGGTFEDSVYNKTVFKMQLASRVVDKKRPVAKASKKIGEFLFEPKDVPQTDLSEFKGMDPQVLDKILGSQQETPTIRAIIQTDSFERDDIEDKLTAEEQKEVKQLIDDEKLKRSNPEQFAELIAKRSRKLHDQALRQGPQPIPSPVGIRASINSQIPHATPQAAGVRPPVKIQPPSQLYDPASTKESTSSKVNINAKDSSPILPPEAALSDPTPTAPIDSGREKAKALDGSISNGISSARPHQERHGKLAEVRKRLDVILSEASRKFHQLNGSQSSSLPKDKFAEFGPTIRKEIRRQSTNEDDLLVNLGRAADKLKGDSVQCQALLGGEISVPDFVKTLVQTMDPPIDEGIQESSRYEAEESRRPTEAVVSTLYISTSKSDASSDAQTLLNNVVGARHDHTNHAEAQQLDVGEPVAPQVLQLLFETDQHKEVPKPQAVSNEDKISQMSSLL